MASQQIIDDVLGALVRRCPNGLGRKYYSLDEVAGLFPDVEREVLEEALYDAEAEILVEKRQVLSGPLSVRLTLNCFEKFDPTVMGWTPRTDALKLAELMLKHNVERTADLEELSGMERRRFNPAFDWLLSYPLSTQDGFVSKELSSEFRASSVILAPEVKAALRRFISSETSTGTLARPSPLGALGELALGELPGVAYQGDLKSSGAEAKAAIGVIEDRIAQSPREIEEMVGGLSALIEQEIDRLSAATPNAPDDLERHNQYRDFLMQVQRQLHDPPPLKWSDLRYVFDTKEDCNGKEAIQV